MSTDLKRIGPIAKAIRDRVAARSGFPVEIPCPECEHRGPHETNGSLEDPSACCAQCGTHFDVTGEITP